MAFNQFGQQGYGQYGMQQNELGNIIGAVVQATVPAILGSLRSQQQFGGSQLGVPAFHQQGQHGGQADVGNVLGPVLQATLPIILGSLRGQQQGWQGAQGFGQQNPWGVPAFQQQAYGGQADLGNVIGPVLQATLPAVLQSLRAQQNVSPFGQQGFGQFGIPAFYGAQQGQGNLGQADQLGSVIGPVLQAAVPAILGSLQASQAGQAATGWRN
jgi:hypothetical protein